VSSKHNFQHFRTSISYFVILLLMQSLKMFMFPSFKKNVRFQRGSISRKYVFSYAVKDLTLNKQKHSVRSLIFPENYSGS